MSPTRHLSFLLALGLAAFCACSSEDPPLRHDRGASPDGGAAVDELGNVPFEPVGPAVYVPKIKNLLTGLAATDGEVAAVTADAGALTGLVDQWMTLPSFEARMLDFFRNAFQQNGVRYQDVLDTYRLGAHRARGGTSDDLTRNIMDSFPRTALALVKEGRPFTETITTRRHMMTSGLLGWMSYVDDLRTADDNARDNRLLARAAVPSYTFDAAAAVPYEQSGNPRSASFMKWSLPDSRPSGCTSAAAQTYLPTDSPRPTPYYTRLMSLMMGVAVGYNPCDTAVSGRSVADAAPVYGDADWSDWRMVTFAADGNAASATPSFYDIGALRAASSVTLGAEHVGFFGSMAFQVNWPTNTGNSARVTANQSLIVALGQSIAGESSLSLFPADADDSDHAGNPACKGCHSQIDPFRNFFRQSYSVYYSHQSDPAEINQSAGFAFNGQVATGSGVRELANIMAANPRFAMAWVEKLHFWASSVAVLSNDAEAMRIAEAFVASNHDFKTLVRELFTSPLVTLARPTKTTTTNGVIVSIARRDQFCSALSNRLEIVDLCGMSSVKPNEQQRNIATRAIMMPQDSYFRAYALPTLANEPDLFFRQSVESVCGLVADQVIDVRAPAKSRYVSTNPDAAIADFVATVMGIVPADPKHGPALALLKENYDGARTGGANAKDALKATFNLACISPPSVIIGL